MNLWKWIGIGILVVVFWPLIGWALLFLAIALGII